MLDRARFHWAVVTIYKGFYIAPNLSHQLHDSNRANPVANPGWNARGFMGGLWVGAIASDRNSVPPKSSARIADNEFAPHSAIRDLDAIRPRGSWKHTDFSRWKAPRRPSACIAARCAMCVPATDADTPKGIKLFVLVVTRGQCDAPYRPLPNLSIVACQPAPLSRVR
jgi:hypothetical protein